MGLRFRKSISLLPGVKLNLSKSGVGVSAGIPGLRGSINTSGRATATASIPGTGVSYVKTKKVFGGKKADSKAKTEKVSAKTAKSAPAPESKTSVKKAGGAPSAAGFARSVQIDANTLKSIHGTADEKIDWKKLAASASPEDTAYAPEVWEYLHEAAPRVLGGDIDTYLQLIADVNPLDDLLSYGANFEFGTDDPQTIEVEFVINDAALTEARQTMKPQEYHALLQDFVCSMALRIARDMFALLPVRHTVVHVDLDGATVFSVDFDEATLSRINFAYIDASNTATQFRNNMKFDPKNGFASVNRL